MKGNEKYFFNQNNSTLIVNKNKAAVNTLNAAV